MKKSLQLQTPNHYLQYFAARKHLDLFANAKLNVEQTQLLVFKNTLALQEVASECFDYEMCSLKTMNEPNHVAARMHSWAWSAAAAELMEAAATGSNHRRSSRYLQSAHMWMRKHMQEHSLKKKSNIPSIHLLLPFPGACDSCLQASGGPHPGQRHSPNSLVLLHNDSFKCIWIST